MSNQVSRQTGRNTGIDRLRITATFMILILHVLNMGKVLWKLPQNSWSFYIGMAMVVACVCAVNCYGLISGYVGLYARYRYSKLAVLWLQVVFYNLLGLGLSLLLQPCQITAVKLIKTITPVLSSSFWYFTAYFGVFLLMPLLNKGLQALTRRQARVLCILLVVVFSGPPLLLAKDSFVLLTGYSFVWLLLMYVLGGCMRRGEVFSRVKNRWLWLIYLLCVAGSLAVRLAMGPKSFSLLGNAYTGNLIIEYISPTVLLCAMVLLVAFSRMKTPTARVQKVIGVLAPASFGIYIVHTQSNVCQWLFTLPYFQWLAQLPLAAMVAMVILSAVGLYLACAAIELLRRLLFDALKIPHRLQRLEEKYLGTLWDE